MAQYKINIYSILYTFIIILFTFQSGLEKLWHGFSYIDELTACAALPLAVIHYGLAKKCLSNKTILLTITALLIFVISGLTGNFIYMYQPVSLVAKDLLTNIKFFLSLVTGYLFFSGISLEPLTLNANHTARFLSVILLLVFCVDRIFDLYGGEVRHGIRSAKLFYSHSTYYAGALAFLLTLLVVFYRKRNWLFIGADVIMMIFTLRSKAIAAATAYLFLFWYLLVRKKKLKLWQLILIAVIGVCVAWQQIYFYYIRLAGKAARSIMTITSLKIMRDFFPIGTGFGTYASHAAAERYSPVYLLYGFADMWDVSYKNPNAFLDDTFWPIILGQTGFIGTVAYLLLLFTLIWKCLQLKSKSRYIYMGGLFIIVYLLISSMAEPAFNNAVAIPLAFMLGIIFQKSSDKYSTRILE